MKKNLFIKTYLLGILASIFLVPFFVYAQTYSQDLFGLYDFILDIFNDLVLWGIVAAAVGWYMFKLLKMMVKGDFDTQLVIYGIIALTVMFSFYAVTGLIASTFGIKIGIPQFYKEQTLFTPGTGNVINPNGVIR